MNVLHVNKYYHPLTGGVESVVRTLAEGTSERGHDVRVLASQPRGAGSTDRHNGVEVYKTSSVGVIKSVPLAPSFPARYRRHIRWADVVHHHVPNPLGTVSDLLTPTDGVTVATYHSDIVRQKYAKLFFQPLQDRFLDRLDHIFVTSPRLLDCSETLQNHADRCSVAPLSIDLDKYEQADDPEESLGDSSRPTVLFVGRLNYYKGLEQLVDAAQFIDADVIIAGDGDRREALERRTAERNVSETVTFLGYVAEERLKPLYAASDVFVLPSIEPSEAFGIVQLEAMSQRTPVVNTDLQSGVPWVSKDGETGLTVQPGDAEALAEAVNTLLADDEKRNQYGAKARERVETKFSDEQLIDTVVERYERLLK